MACPAAPVWKSTTRRVLAGEQQRYRLPDSPVVARTRVAIAAAARSRQDLIWLIQGLLLIRQRMHHACRGGLKKRPQEPWACARRPDGAAWGNQHPCYMLDDDVVRPCQ